MFEMIAMMFVIQPLPGQELTAPVVRREDAAVTRPAPAAPLAADLSRDRVPPAILVADSEVFAPREHAVEREEPAVADDDSHADRARQWGWLFEHGSRHHGPAAPRFDHDTRHIF